MAAVDEWIAREYFEMLGYFVYQPRKYTVPGRQKLASEEMDLVIVNPTVSREIRPERLLWTSEDFAGVPRAVVGIRGWHTERFYASTFEQVPDILRFVEPESRRFAAGILGTDAMANVICLPRLPASGDLKEKTIQALRERGIDGVISFRAMLEELILRVETNRNYEKSDLLQIIRLLKNYELIKNPQLELFAKAARPDPATRRASRRARPPSAAETAPPA